MTFDLRVPRKELEGSSNTTVALGHVCLTLQLIFHIILTLLPRSYLLCVLQSLKAGQFQLLGSCFFLLRTQWSTTFKAARKRPLRRRKHLFSFGDSMTQQHDLAEIVHMPKFTTLNYKLGCWRGSEPGNHWNCCCLSPLSKGQCILPKQRLGKREKARVKLARGPEYWLCNRIIYFLCVTEWFFSKPPLCYMSRFFFWW